MNNSVLDHAKRLGDRAVACIADITSAEQMQQAIDEAIALGGGSGLSVLFTALASSAWPSWLTVMATPQTLATQKRSTLI